MSDHYPASFSPISSKFLQFMLAGGFLCIHSDPEHPMDSIQHTISDSWQPIISQAHGNLAGGSLHTSLGLWHLAGDLLWTSLAIAESFGSKYNLSQGMSQNLGYGCPLSSLFLFCILPSALE